MTTGVSRYGQGASQPPVIVTSYHSHQLVGQSYTMTPLNESPPQRTFQDPNFLNVESSGLFVVPTDTNPLTMNIYVSSHVDTPEPAQLQINRVVNSSKSQIFDITAFVPAQGAIVASLDLQEFGLRGATIEVVFRSPDPTQLFELLPSVDVVEFFPADGATLPLEFIPPSYFTQVFPSDATTQPIDQEPPPPIMVSTGIFDVPQGVAAAITEVHITLSSFSNEELQAVVEVNRLQNSQKEPVQNETIVVPPGAERELVLTGLDGLTVEVNLTLSRDQKGNALLPSVQVTVLFTSDGTEESQILIPAGAMMGVFVAP